MPARSLRPGALMLLATVLIAHGAEVEDGAAGDAAARIGGERGLLPSDLFPHLRRLANPEETGRLKASE